MKGFSFGGTLLTTGERWLYVNFPQSVLLHYFPFRLADDFATFWTGMNSHCAHDNNHT